MRFLAHESCDFAAVRAGVNRIRPGMPIELHGWSGYDAGCPETNSWRNRIQMYLDDDDEPYPQDRDFDRVRPRLAELPEAGNTLE